MKNLAAALLKVQQALDPVKKGAKGHNNKYADLPAVLDEAVQKLNDNGVVVLQPIQPASQPHHARVETVLLHAESGETITGAAEVPWRSESRMNDAQSYGSAVTYARRYSLVSILGIPTEDDDGKAAHSKPAPAKPELTPEQKAATALQQAQHFVQFKPTEPELLTKYLTENAARLERCAAYPEAKKILEAAGLLVTPKA